MARSLPLKGVDKSEEDSNSEGQLLRTNEVLGL